MKGFRAVFSVVGSCPSWAILYAMNAEEAIAKAQAHRETISKDPLRRQVRNIPLEDITLVSVHAFHGKWKQPNAEQVFPQIS